MISSVPSTIKWCMNWSSNSNKLVKKYIYWRAKRTFWGASKLWMNLNICKIGTRNRESEMMITLPNKCKNEKPKIQFECKNLLTIWLYNRRLGVNLNLGAVNPRQTDCSSISSEELGFKVTVGEVSPFWIFSGASKS